MCWKVDVHMVDVYDTFDLTLNPNPNLHPDGKFWEIDVPQWLSGQDGSFARAVEPQVGDHCLTAMLSYQCLKLQTQSLRLHY